MPLVCATVGLEAAGGLAFAGAFGFGFAGVSATFRGLGVAALVTVWLWRGFWKLTSRSWS
jgi:hypothetical protein